MGRLLMKLSKFEFVDMIKEYSVTFQMEYPGTTTEPKQYDDLGKVINKGDDVPTTGEGALIPLSHRQIYNSGGRYTEGDRQLYTTDHNIPPKTKIFYKGMTYSVESKVPWEDYADFSQYMLKGVDIFV